MSTATATATATTTSSSTTTLDYLELCRLCLVKERANVPIFEDEGDVRQIFLKIAACLPVKVSRDDKLPKKICDDCVYKVELFYQFWNTTANAEKQLLEWLGDVGGLEDKEFDVLDTNVMKQEGRDNRLDGSVMQISGHQNNMEIGIIDNMSIIQMPDGSEQFTAVPMDASTTIQVVGSSTQVTHDQSQVAHIEEVESEIEDNSDDGCDNEEGLPVKEETEEEQASRAMETQFVTISGDQAGPSGLQQQKMKETQRNADDPKTQVDVDHSYETRVMKVEYPNEQPQSNELLEHLSEEENEHHHFIKFSPNSHDESQDDNGLKSQSSEIVIPYNEIDDQQDNSDKELDELPEGINIQEYEDIDSGPMLPSNNDTFFGAPESPVENVDDEDDSENCHDSKNNPTAEPIRSILVKLDTGAIKRLYRCNHCDQVFDSVKHCVKHMGIAHPNTRKYRVAYRCKTCSKLFKTKYGCENHIQSKHKNHTIRCRYCDFETTSITYIKKHERNHLDNYEIRCDICNKGFASKHVLMRHRITHTGEKPFTCKECNACYADMRSLKLHATIHDPEGRTKKYSCDICEYSSFWKNAVKTHMKVHTGAKVICDECGQAVASNYYLKIHKRIHSDEKPFSCDVCSKGFRQMKNLMVHRRTHNKVKPYKCDLCDKTFSQRVLLKKHKCVSASDSNNV